MKKAIVLVIALLLTFCIANAQEQSNNVLKDESIKIQIAETFSDRADGTIVWDDAAAGFWTGSIFFEWPDAEWRNGQLVLTNFPGLDKSRMTFRIQTKEMPTADINGSVGIGFYIENNTASNQSIGFYMIGSSSCLKNKNGTVLLFIDTEGNVTKSVVTDDSMAVIPAGAKGYVLGYYEDFQNLWSNEAYSPSKDKIARPGFELTNLLIDGASGENVIIDNVFYFGADCTDNNDQQLIQREFIQPTVEPTVEPTVSADDNTITQTSDNSTLIYILSGVIFVASLVAAFIIVKKK